MATGILSVATFSTFVGMHVSIPLGAVSFVGVSVSEVATMLTKKYQKKLVKVTKLADIVMSAIAVFEMSISKVLNNGEELHFKVINELCSVDCKMESETRNQLQKSLLEEINEIKKT